MFTFLEEEFDSIFINSNYLEICDHFINVNEVISNPGQHRSKNCLNFENCKIVRQLHTKKMFTVLDVQYLFIFPLRYAHTREEKQVWCTCVFVGLPSPGHSQGY